MAVGRVLGNGPLGIGGLLVRLKFPILGCVCGTMAGVSKEVVQKLRSRVAELESELRTRQTSSHLPQFVAFRNFLGNAVFQVVCVLIALAVAFSGKVDNSATAVMGAIAFVVGAFGVYGHLPTKVAAVVLIVVYGVCLWKFCDYLLTKAGPLTVRQKTEMTAILKTTLVRPDSIRIACPHTDENACIYAASFIPLFQKAGWNVEGPEVERDIVGRPTTAVVIVSFAPPPSNPQDPDAGSWTVVNPWQQVLETGLEFVGIHPVRQSDPLLPKSAVRLYFGSAPGK
jgi:hypothetical protein